MRNILWINLKITKYKKKTNYPIFYRYVVKHRFLRDNCKFNKNKSRYLKINIRHLDLNLLDCIEKQRFLSYDDIIDID
jgi:hypothetical protein